MDENAKLQSKVRELVAAVETREDSERERQTRIQALQREVSENESTLANLTAAKCEVEQTFKATDVSWRIERFSFTQKCKKKYKKKEIEDDLTKIAVLSQFRTTYTSKK